MKSSDQTLLDMAQAVITTEEKAIQLLKNRLSDAFIQAHHYLLNCKGRIVVTGIGKSGHIGNKIAATLASTGSPAFFIHPAEASHGDLGMITTEDVLIVISYSGETPEITSLMPLIKLKNIPIISLTGQPNSTLAQAADVNLNIQVEQEACPLQLAPTASTTATLVMGDALAITLLSAKGFTEDDFANAHPGGALGKTLLSRVKALMHTEKTMPVISATASFAQALAEISEKRLGHTLVVNDQQILVGIITDGDVRRIIEQQQSTQIENLSAAEVMTQNPTTITSDCLATEALKLMESKQITGLPVVDKDAKPIGLLHMHDILKAGIMIQ